MHRHSQFVPERGLAFRKVLADAAGIVLAGRRYASVELLEEVSGRRDPTTVLAMPHPDNPDVALAVIAGSGRFMMLDAAGTERNADAHSGTPT